MENLLESKSLRTRERKSNSERKEIRYKMEGELQSLLERELPTWMIRRKGNDLRKSVNHPLYDYLMMEPKRRGKRATSRDNKRKRGNLYKSFGKSITRFMITGRWN